MKFVVSAVIVAVGIVTFAVLDNWADFTRPANVISFENGNVQLGEVFYESAGQSITLENPVDGSVLFSVETMAYDLAARVEREVRGQVHQANQDVAEADRVTYEAGSFVEPVRLVYRGWVHFQAEHNPNFQLNIHHAMKEFEGNELTLVDLVHSVAELEQATRPLIEEAFLLKP